MNLCFRHQKALMVATCSAVTEATPRGERGAQNDASASSTGVVMLSVKNVLETSRFLLATKVEHLVNKLHCGTSC